MTTHCVSSALLFRQQTMSDFNTFRTVAKYSLKGLVLALLLVVYIPLYVLLTVVLFSKMTFVLLKHLFNYGTIESPSMSLVSRKHRVADISEVSTSDRLDFMWNRGMCYVNRMAWWTPWEVLKLIFREQMVEEMSDQQLVYTLLTTVYAHHVRWNEGFDRLIFDLSDFDSVVSFKGYYWEVREVTFSEDASDIVIRMAGGEVLRSSAHDELGKQNYRLAKVHLQACLSYYAAGLAHNHVHFVFPSAMCRAVKARLIRNPKSVLRKLLLPHLRFTESINYQALQVGNSNNNTRSFLDRYVFLWKSFPVTSEEFVEGIARHCRQYYFEKQTPTGATGQGKRPRSVFPPEFVTDKWKQKIPYNYFLKRYYHVIEEFMRNIEHLIDKNEWKDVAQEVAKYVPGFDKVDMVTGATIFIHQAAVVHSSDHETYNRFMRTYGCMSMRSPFEPYSSVDEWRPILNRVGRSLDEIKSNPLLLLAQTDVMRTRVFLNVFGSYIFNSCEQRLSKTDYEFDDEDAKSATDEFLKQLHELDRTLQSETPIANLAGLDETRCEGNQLAELDQLVRSISF